MDCLERNMYLIKMFRLGLYGELDSILASGIYSYDNIKELDTRDGNKALVIEKDNNEYRLNSLYKPLKEAEKWADQYEFQNLNISVIMFGTGNGLFISEMLKRLKQDAKVYLYEPDISVFLYILNNVDISNIICDARVNLFIKNINQDRFKLLLQKETDWMMITSQIICNHPVYDKIYTDEFEEFLNIVYSANNLAKVNIDTERYLADTLVNNTIKNLKFIKESNYVSEFIGKIPEELPAIIVAAGPSLDKNIDELKRAEGKAFIFATDTSVKYLLKHDIKFDAIITIDAKKAIGHLKDERCHNIPLFCVIEARNQMMEMHKGRKIWFRGSVYMYGLYNKFNRFFPSYNSGGSVSTAAFSVCLSMNFKNIVFIGQDLAYDGEVTHAGGVVKKIIGEKKGKEQVDAIDGGKVWSRYDWLIYLEWLENSIKDIKGINVIDATEGGALIHGSKVMKLSEVIDQYCNNKFSFSNLLGSMPYTFTDDEYSKVREELLDIRKEFSDIKNKSKEGIKLANRIIKSINNKNNTGKNESKDLKRIDKINKFLEKQAAYDILDIYISNIVVKDLVTVNNLSEDEDENMKKTLEISITIYKALMDGIEKLTPVLEETLEQI